MRLLAYLTLTVACVALWLASIGEVLDRMRHGDAALSARIDRIAPAVYEATLTAREARNAANDARGNVQTVGERTECMGVAMSALIATWPKRARAPEPCADLVWPEFGAGTDTPALRSSRSVPLLRGRH